MKDNDYWGFTTKCCICNEQNNQKSSLSKRFLSNDKFERLLLYESKDLIKRFCSKCNKITQQFLISYDKSDVND